MSLASYLLMFKGVLPPWLLRIEGLKLIGAFADVIDDHRDRLVAGVKLRFPGLYALEGLALIGKERKLRRGPNEDAEVFADRLPRWWEDHQTRGNGYALLEQMLAYLVGTLSPPYDAISYLGVRHSMSGTPPTVTRDTITWGTDGDDDHWARLWVILYTTASSPASAATMESYAAIVRDWIPAHISPCYVVLVHPDTRLWDYPTPVPDWDDGWDWDDGPTIVDVLEI